MYYCLIFLIAPCIRFTSITISIFQMRRLDLEKLSCPRWHSWYVVPQIFEPRQFDSRAHAFNLFIVPPPGRTNIPPSSLFQPTGTSSIIWFLYSLERMPLDKTIWRVFKCDWCLRLHLSIEVLRNSTVNMWVFKTKQNRKWTVFEGSGFCLFSSQLNPKSLE